MRGGGGVRIAAVGKRKKHGHRKKTQQSLHHLNSKNYPGASPADWAADRGHASLALMLTSRASADRKAAKGGGGGGKRRSSSSSRGGGGFLQRLVSGAAVAALAATAVAAAVAAHRLPQARAAAKAAKAKPKKGWF